MKRETKYCSRCDTVKLHSEFYVRNKSRDGLCVWCKPCQAKEQAKRQKNNAEKGLCRCGKLRREGRKGCDSCLDSAVRSCRRDAHEHRARSKAANYKNKIAAFVAYGNKCSCCPEDLTEFLEIDHVGGWGKYHKNAGGSRISGGQLYLWLKAEDYPGGFRLLCGSCHTAISYQGYCPHEKIRAMSAIELVNSAVNWGEKPEFTVQPPGVLRKARRRKSYSAHTSNPDSSRS